MYESTLSIDQITLKWICINHPSYVKFESICVLTSLHMSDTENPV